MTVSPIGYVRCALKQRKGAPRQSWEDAPEAVIELLPEFVQARHGLEPGQAIWILTWLHESNREILEVYPRGQRQNQLTGVFATRSPDRPNPIGLHRVELVGIEGRWLKVRALEAIDGTPIIDIKPVLPGENRETAEP